MRERGCRGALIVVLLACALAATPAHAQYDAFGTVGLTAGTLPKPYVSSCLDDRSEFVALRGGLGVRRGLLELASSVLVGGELQTVACDLVPVVLSDGVHTFRAFDESGQHSGVKAATATAGIALPFAPMIVANVGGGIELEWGDPIFTYGVAWRSSGRKLRLAAGVQVMEIQASYTRVRQTWQNGQVVQASEVGAGSSWRRSIGINVGGEFSLAGDARRAGGSK